jgi:hypothetical protein
MFPLRGVENSNKYKIRRGSFNNQGNIIENHDSSCNNVKLKKNMKIEGKEIEEYLKACGIETQTRF